VFFAGRDAEHGLELWKSDGTGPGTMLVADIYPGPTGSFPTKPVDFGGVAFFVADDGVHGEEIWMSTGTAAGTQMVRDIWPGSDGSFPSQLVAINGLLYFQASDPAGGRELWRSDGTAAGTFAAADVTPGPTGSNPQNVTPLGGLVLFVANDSVHGFEPWVTDGTPGGAQLLADVNPGPFSMYALSWPFGGPFPVFDGKAYFPADDGTHGSELWRTDGSPSGTELFMDLVDGPDSSFPAPRLALSDGLLFTVTDGPGDPNRLWRTDGTELGTVQVAGVGPAQAESIVEMDGAIYFVVSRSQLWKTDGTPGAEELVYDIGQPACAANHFFTHLTPVDGRIFMVGRAPGGDDEPWISDGTTIGTQKIADIRPNGSSPFHVERGSEPTRPVPLGDIVLFTADDGEHGRELWRTDGSEQGTSMVADLVETTDYFYTGREDGSVAFDDRLYFAAFDKRGLWRSDGTEAGTEMVPGTESLEMPSSVRRPEPFLAATDEQVFFWPRHSSFYMNLWRSDGTASGTYQLGGPFSSICSVTEQATLGNVLYFGGCPNGSNPELWRSDGTPGGTFRLRDIRPGINGSNPRILTPLRQTLFFFADDGVHGSELWRSDGTAPGTTLVKDINPGAAQGAGFDLPPLAGIGTNLRPLIAGDGVVYFAGNDGVHGKELWKSDGTAAGTKIVKDIAPGPGGGLGVIPSAQALADWAVTDDGQLHFLLYNLALGWELWRSDGTAAGTAKVASVLPATTFFDLLSMRIFAVGNQVFFSGNGGMHELRLWQSNGTPGGTHPFPEFVPTATLALVDDALYFTDPDFRNPIDLRMIEVGAQESASIGTVAGDNIWVDPSSVAQLGGLRFFAADNGILASELWTSSCGDGAVEHDEACDDGAENGRIGSCCTRACEERTWPASDVDGDDTLDWCDSQEGELVLEFVSLRRRLATPSENDGRVLVHGSFEQNPAGLDLAQGISLEVNDASGQTASAHFAARDCQARTVRTTRCRSGNPTADLRLRRKDGTVEYWLRIKGLTLEEGMEGPVTVSLTHGRIIDRVGVSGPCGSGGDALVCR
jgi:ELWxxDGT repeat protein